jgi:hypothetical protein
MTPREPSWTFGGKARKKRGWGWKEPEKKKSIVVGGFTVAVPEADYTYAKAVLEDDMMLREIFLWVMDEILENKPAAPLGQFRDRFGLVRGQFGSLSDSDREGLF